MTLQEFGAADEGEGGLASYQAQLSLGLHILVMMGTFFAAGFHGVSYVSSKPLHVGRFPFQSLASGLNRAPTRKYALLQCPVSWLLPVRRSLLLSAVVYN